MERKWWHDKIAYEIYPKSFCDSNGDGIGDIPGIISKLDYLKDLGIDILWICPMYESPFVDQGYDISDYYKIADCFGTMEDFERLVEETKKRDMYIIMDLVINHCSSEHVWFQEALKDPYGKYGNYFYFEKGRDGKEPSNYRSYFGGNMWEKVEGYDDLYYYHSFSKEQPDLNWNNPEVTDTLYEMINWWFEKGVAGFRVDAIINIKKNTSFPSFEPDGPDGLCAVDRVIDDAADSQEQTIGDMLHALREHTFSKHAAFTVGEVFNMQEDELREFIGEDGHFSTIFDFSLHLLTNCESGWYNAHVVTPQMLKKAIFDSQLSTQDTGFMANIIENHDEPRGVDVFLPPWIDKETGAKLLGTIMVMEHGIPFLYQGQEIGMTNMEFTSLDQYNDINTKDQYHQALERGYSEEEALTMCNLYSRDNARTPMQWSDKDGAGFTDGTPWMVINTNYKTINVEAQQNNPASVLQYYKKLIALRKNPDYADALVEGRFRIAEDYMDGDDSPIMAFYREGTCQKLLVISNWGTENIRFTAADRDGNLKKLLDSFYVDGSEPEQDADRRVFVLAPGQICVYSCEK